MGDKNPLFRRILPLVWGLIIMVLFAGGYYLLHRRLAPLPQKKTLEKITIAYTTGPHAILAVIAHTQGFFLEEGLDVTPRKHRFGKPALEDMLAGNADFATVGDTPLMFAIMNGAPVSVIATIQTSNRDNAIVARKDKGILTPGDLKGRKVGVLLGTTSEFYMDVFLAIHGIARKDIQVVDLGADELVNALADGAVDAISGFNPHSIYAQRRLGDIGVVFYDEEIYTLFFMVVAKQDFIRANPVKIKKVLKALLRAEKFVQENPGTAQAMVADFNETDLGLMRTIWADYSYGVNLDQSLILALEDESRWAVNEKLVKNKKVPNYLNFIYLDGLSSVAPRSVRILR